MIDNEIWEWVPRLEGRYKISNFGRILKCDDADDCLLVEFKINDHGYLGRTIRVDGKPTNFKIHRIMGEVFIPNPNNHATINHIDGDKLNNHHTNLEWVSIENNIQHAIEIGLRKRCWKQKMDEEKVRKARHIYETTDISISQLGRDFGITTNTMKLILEYKTWANVDPHLNKP